MGLWDSVISDCNQCLDLAPDNMKAHYYLSQAHLALRDYDDALDHALRAHELGIATADKSLSAITAQVLKCKKERWEDLDRRRKREGAELESEVMAMMERERDEALRETADNVERSEVEAEWQQKMAHMKTVFEKARPAEERRRTVPDWIIDDISFAVMVDPVVVSLFASDFTPPVLLSLSLTRLLLRLQTKTGKSYERASLLEHLRRHPIDPLTREPLYPTDLRPNLALKEACAEFLEENGWAVDW